MTLPHPGIMGAAVGAQAIGVGATVRWVSAGRSPATGDRAIAAGFVECADIPTALKDTDLVLSICPPANTEDIAHAIADFDGVFVQANATTPERTCGIGSLVPNAQFVDGGIIGGPPVAPGTTRLYVSGHVQPVVELFEGTALQVVTLPGAVGQASALKLAYASYQKASRVLAAIARALASHHGIDAQLTYEAELLHSRPPCGARGVYVSGRSRMAPGA